MDLSGDSVAILNFTVSSRYYGMLRGQTSMYFPAKHSINSFFKSGFPIAEKVHWVRGYETFSLRQCRKLGFRRA